MYIYKFIYILYLVFFYVFFFIFIFEVFQEYRNEIGNCDLLYFVENLLQYF